MKLKAESLKKKSIKLANFSQSDEEWKKENTQVTNIRN